VSWPCCWHICLDFFEKSFRSLSPLLASKFWVWQKNTSATAKCSCLGVSAVSSCCHPLADSMRFWLMFSQSSILHSPM
jgi:hypothetical protein